jgi:predicted amidohydrolase YtcJ
MRFYAGGQSASSLATTVIVAAFACVVSLYTLPSAAPPVRPARQGSCFRFAKLGDNRLCSDNGTTTTIINATLHSSHSRNITIEISACGTLVRVGQSLSPSLGSSIINAGGRTVTKGLVDSHLHLITGGRTLSESRSFVNLSNVSTISHLKAAIAHATPEYGWIRAHSLPGTHRLQRLPDRDELDAAVNSVEIAVLIETEDQHSAIANTEALRQGNLTSSSSSPQSGTVETDAAGVPNGVLRDNAIAPVRSAALAHSSNESRYHAIEAALELIVSHGVTTVGDMQDIDALAAGDSGRIWSDVLLLRQLANSGRLRARVASFLPESVFSEHPGGEHELRQEHSSSSMHSITGGTCRAQSN